MTPLRAGAQVRTKPTVRPRRYADRSGRIEQVKRSEGEISVALGAQVVWFRPDELVPEAQR